MKKQTLHSLGVDSISFYTTQAVPNIANTYNIFLCNADATSCGQITINTTTKTFTSGTSPFYVMIKIPDCTNENPLYAFVGINFSGTLSTDNFGNFYFDQVYPVLLTSNLTVQTIGPNGTLTSFTPLSLQTQIKCALKGTIKFAFPQQPISTWLGYNQYFSAAYIQSELV